MSNRTKRALSRTLALVMALTLLCAASLLTACEPPKDSGADAADLDKADDFSQSEEMGRKQLPEDTSQPEGAPRQIDSQPQEKKQPGTPQPSMLTVNPTPTPAGLQITPIPKPKVDPNIGPATPKPATPTPQPPEPPPESQEGHTRSRNCPKCGGGICKYAEEVQTPQGEPEPPQN